MALKSPGSTSIREIYCCKCDTKVQARLTKGKEIYPHRIDLAEYPFWKCDICSNYVGCHRKTSTPTEPLGYIPYPELRNWRKIIHDELDPIWQQGGWNRSQLYRYLSKQLGWRFHVSCIRSVTEAKKVYHIIQALAPSYAIAQEIDQELDRLFEE